MQSTYIAVYPQIHVERESELEERNRDEVADMVLKMVLIVLLVSSLTLLTTGLIVQSYAKSLLASFNIQWEGQPSGLMGMFQGALGGKQSSEGEKSGNTSTDQPTGTEEEKAPENSISVMGNGTKEESAGVDTGVGSGNGSVVGNGTAAGSDASSGQGADSGNTAGSDEIVVSPDDITGAKTSCRRRRKSVFYFADEQAASEGNAADLGSNGGWADRAGVARD